MRIQNFTTEQFLLYTVTFIAGGLIFLLIRKLTDHSSEPPSVPVSPNTMPEILIRNMISNYRRNQLAAIQNSLQITDAQSVSFDIRTLKNFIYSIENESRKRNSSVDEKDLGIRFYYAAYPEDLSAPDFDSVDKNYTKKHTLIMIPTLSRLDETGNYMDFDFNPLDGSTYIQGREKTSQPETRMMAVSSKSSSEVVAQNHGGLIPPDSIVTQNY